MIFQALSSVVERSSTTNSSPPKRNTRSWARNEDCSRLAIRISTSSPYRWPNLSLTALKWSTSTTASHCFSSPCVLAPFGQAGQARVRLVGAVQHARQLVVEGLAVEQAGQRIALAVVEQVLEVAVDADDAADHRAWCRRGRAVAARFPGRCRPCRRSRSAATGCACRRPRRSALALLARWARQAARSGQRAAQPARRRGRLPRRASPP